MYLVCRQKFTISFFRKDYYDEITNNYKLGILSFLVDPFKINLYLIDEVCNDGILQ